MPIGGCLARKQTGRAGGSTADMALLGRAGGAIGGVPTAELRATYGQIQRLARPNQPILVSFRSGRGPKFAPRRAPGIPRNGGATIVQAGRLPIVLTTP